MLFGFIAGMFKVVAFGYDVTALLILKNSWGETMKKIDKLRFVIWAFVILYSIISLVIKNIPCILLSILMYALAYRTNNLLKEYDD